MLDTPADQQDFLTDVANEYGTLRGDPLKIAREQKGLAGEDALHDFLLGLVEVRLRHASGNNVQAKTVVAAMLKSTPCHLLSYLLDYFLCQLQVGDWYVAPPFLASPKVASLLQGRQQPVTLTMKLLRKGCLGTTQYLATTQSDYVFGYAEAGRLNESPEALAGDASSSPLVVPLRVDDCMAIVAHNEDTGQLEATIGICVRKFDRAKGSKRREEGYQKRLRLMRPSLSSHQLSNTLVTIMAVR